MVRHRTIHDKNRKSSYRINLDNVTEDLHIIINDEDGNIYFDKIIPFACLRGVRDLHFKFLSNKVVWNGPSSIVIGN